MSKCSAGGNVSIDENGIATIIGRGEIKAVHQMDAFGFRILDMKVDEKPEVAFGVNGDSGEEQLVLDYYRILCDLRANCVNPFISPDGINVLINFRITDSSLYLYVNSFEVSSFNLANSSSHFPFIRIKSKQCKVSTPFFSRSFDRAFFPFLPSSFWALPLESSMIHKFEVQKTLAGASTLIYEFPLPIIPSDQIIRYFEFTFRMDVKKRSDSSVCFGFSPPEVSKADSRKGILFDPIGFRVFINDIAFSVERKISDTYGIGVNLSTNTVFVTADKEEIASIKADNLSKLKFFPAVSISSKVSQYFLNLGQVPFSYKLHSTSGWFSYFATQKHLLFRGPDSCNHILGLIKGCGSLIGGSASLIGNKELSETEFEVTFLDNAINYSSIIGVGPSKQNIEIPVGCQNNTLGLRLDGGKTLYMNGNGCYPSLQFNDCGVVVYALALEDKKVVLYAGDQRVLLEAQKPNKLFPTLSFSGRICVMLNFGETPTLHSSKNNFGSLLFNSKLLQLDSDNPFGFSVGDEVESRDLEFRGLYAGSYNNRPYFDVTGITGAVPFEYDDPIEVISLLRVVASSNSELIEPILTKEGVQCVKLASKDDQIAYLKEGVACYLFGHIAEDMVLRPFYDLINNFTPIICKDADKITTIKSPNYLRNTFSLFDLEFDQIGNLTLLTECSSSDKYKSWNGGEIQFSFYNICTKIYGTNFATDYGMKRGGIMYSIGNIVMVPDCMSGNGSSSPRSYSRKFLIPPLIDYLMVNITSAALKSDVKGGEGLSFVYDPGDALKKPEENEFCKEVEIE